MAKANVTTTKKDVAGEKIAPLERWRPVAEALPSDALQLSVPFHVLLGEAVDVAKFFGKYWDNVLDDKKVVVRPGLETAVNPRSKAPAKIGPGTGQEILSLHEATQAAQTAYLLTVDPASANPMDRAQTVLSRLTGTLEWLFDDGVEDENDAQLASLGAEHGGDPSTPDALAGALVDYAALAAPHRAEMDGLGNFDVAMIDEAGKLAKALRNRPAVPAALGEKARAALNLRNRLAMVLSARIALVRGAARFVYSNQPEIVREATSAYERRRRAAARRASQAKAAGPAAAPAKPV